jgi:hypothetical protein
MLDAISARRETGHTCNIWPARHSVCFPRESVWSPRSIPIVISTKEAQIMHTKQVVLITGSSPGFGRLFAETLAGKGHTASGCIRISSAKAGKLSHRRKV